MLRFPGAKHKRKALLFSDLLLRNVCFHGVAMSHALPTPLLPTMAMPSASKGACMMVNTSVHVLQVVVLADVNELPSLTLSQDLLRPKKLGMVKQILDEGTAMIFPVFAPMPKLPADEGNRLARLLVSGKSLRCGGATLLPARMDAHLLPRAPVSQR